MRGAFAPEATATLSVMVAKPVRTGLVASRVFAIGVNVMEGAV